MYPGQAAQQRQPLPPFAGASAPPLSAPGQSPNQVPFASYSSFQHQQSYNSLPSRGSQTQNPNSNSSSNLPYAIPSPSLSLYTYPYPGQSVVPVSHRQSQPGSVVQPSLVSPAGYQQPLAPGSGAAYPMPVYTLPSQPHSPPPPYSQQPPQYGQPPYAIGAASASALPQAAASSHPAYAQPSFGGQSSYSTPPIVSSSSSFSSSPSVPLSRVSVVQAYAVPTFVFPKSIEKEPMLLLDTTASMSYGTSETDETPRKETIREAISIIVEKLGRYDSQASREATEGKDEGGLRTVTFSGKEAIDIGDLSSENLKTKWSHIKFKGGTYIVPGWRKLREVYNEEFGSHAPDSRPLLLALIVTDGDAEDRDEFAVMIAKAEHNVFIVVALCGYGHEYKTALQQYTRIASTNPHMRVIPFSAETDPIKIANALLSFVL